MQNITQIFRSLDDETRLRILALLLEEQELCVCDIMAVLQLPQSTISRHLSHLKNAGWLRDRRETVWIYYSIVAAPGPLQQSMLPILRHFLHDNETAQADRDRLHALAAENSCA